MKQMEIYFLPALFIIAFLYSSIGHGGASGYLAIMAIYGIDTIYMKSSALTLNLFVSAIAFYQFYRGGYFKWRIILPFIITSVPFAFLGARIGIDPTTYKIILGFFLLIATFRILSYKMQQIVHTKEVPYAAGLLTGSLLGFFSGLIGIGGGIILSPVLVMMHWANMKEAAAVSALFIFVNSAAGLTGVYFSGARLTPGFLLWVLIAFTGGLLGAYLGSRKFSHGILRYVLSCILILASVKLFLF